MERFLLVRPPPLSNDVILAPKSINSKANNTKEVVKFKLQGKNYIRCNALTKKPKHTKQRTSKAAAKAAAKAAEAAANAVAKAPPGEPGGPGEPVAREPDDDESESHDEDAYAAFEGRLR